MGDRSSRETLQRMSHALAHRGPDGAETWHQGPVGVATLDRLCPREPGDAGRRDGGASQPW